MASQDFADQVVGLSWVNLSNNEFDEIRVVGQIAGKLKKDRTGRGNVYAVIAGEGHLPKPTYHIVDGRKKVTEEEAIIISKQLQRGNRLDNSVKPVTLGIRKGGSPAYPDEDRRGDWGSPGSHRSCDMLSSFHRSQIFKGKK